MSYAVKLGIFEGPLDLLLHLIRKQEIDIYDIPIALITRQYLNYLDLMKTLNLEVAGEFLVVAATLAQIKSRMLLPREDRGEGEEEGPDPREELVRRLVEHERFKEAASTLETREALWQDVFARQGKADLPAGEEDLVLSHVGIFDLLDALRTVLDRIPDQRLQQITLDQITVSEKIAWILERLRGAEALSFEALFEGSESRVAVIVTFLALLELIRLKMVAVRQERTFGAIEIQMVSPQEGHEGVMG